MTLRDLQSSQMDESTLISCTLLQLYQISMLRWTIQSTPIHVKIQMVGLKTSPCAGIQSTGSSPIIPCRKLPTLLLTKATLCLRLKLSTNTNRQRATQLVGQLTHGLRSIREVGKFLSQWHFLKLQQSLLLSKTIKTI